MRPRIWVYVALFLIALALGVSVNSAMVGVSAIVEPERPFSTWDESGLHKVESGYLEATETSLTVNGKNFYQDKDFSIMTFYDTPVTLQIDGGSPIKAAQVVIYFNDHDQGSRVAWQISVDSDWQVIMFDQIEKVTVTP